MADNLVPLNENPKVVQAMEIVKLRDRKAPSAHIKEKTMNRPTYLNEGWTSEGVARKNWAKENNMCAFCGDTVPKGKRLYCSRKCSLRFSNDPRYHSGIFLWSRIRAEVLWENKICQKCGNYPSSEVDHIKEIASGGDPFAKTNLQALCALCHKKKTASFLRRGFVRGRHKQELMPKEYAQKGNSSSPERNLVSSEGQYVIEDF